MIFGGCEMQRLMDGVLDRYGVEALVKTAEGEQRVKVLFRSVKSDAMQNAQLQISYLGRIPCGRYICLLPVAVKASVEDTLTVGGKAYLLRQIEPVAALAEVVCYWCLCVEKGGEL